MIDIERHRPVELSRPRFAAHMTDCRRGHRVPESASFCQVCGLPLR